MSEQVTPKDCCKKTREETLRLLASAMKKIMPPELVQEIIYRGDPLAAFLREIGEKLAQ
jgi:hypothetical protein